jgi:hypothetical protein
LKLPGTIWCDNLYFGVKSANYGGKSMGFGGSFPLAGHICSPGSSLSSCKNISHEYHTYQKYKYLNTGKTSTPKKFQRQEAHLVMALTRTSGPQLDKAGPGFDIRFLPKPSRNSM